ncbi:MAG: class D sortase [Terracidiphilus sp.]|jgi:sortase A
MILITEQEIFAKRGQRFICWTRRILLLAGVLALAYVALTLFNARLFQNAASRALDGQIHAEELHTVIPARKSVKEGDLLGRMEIPRIGLSVMVLQGTSSKTLRLGVGHISGTALPGESGNIGIAGHRDTFFRSLKNIHREDEILLQTTAGIARYEVDWIQITAPGDSGIVSTATESGLTLVTCYPFYYIGAAPERFVVHAHRLRQTEAGGR